MHDKGRALQDYKRRMWLQELLDEVHTADIRELPVRTSGGGGGASSGLSPSTTGSSSLQARAPGGTKDMSFKPEDEDGTILPQETDKSSGHKDGGSLMKLPGKKKKKDRSGKRREGERRRRARSSDLTFLRLDWRSLLGGL